MTFRIQGYVKDILRIFLKNHGRIKVWVSLERYEARLSGYVITFRIQGYFKDILRTFLKNHARIKVWVSLER